ncbi:hypothetical protein E2320_019120, partial [Naja naja]
NGNFLQCLFPYMDLSKLEKGCQTITYLNSSSMVSCLKESDHKGDKEAIQRHVESLLQVPGYRHTSWETLAQDQLTWYTLIHQVCQTCEDKRTTTAQKKRALRKARATNAATMVSTYICPTCGRTFCAHIGLTSHLRTQLYTPSSFKIRRGKDKETQAKLNKTPAVQ